MIGPISQYDYWKLASPYEEDDAPEGELRMNRIHEDDDDDDWDDDEDEWEDE